MIRRISVEITNIADGADYVRLVPGGSALESHMLAEALATAIRNAGWGRGPVGYPETASRGAAATAANGRDRVGSKTRSTSALQRTSAKRRARRWAKPWCVGALVVRRSRRTPRSQV